MTDTPIAELRACPFCGRAADVVPHVEQPDDRASIIGAHAECGYCEFNLPPCPTEAEAITAWNTRAQSDVERELLGALRRLYRGYVHTLEIGRDRIISLGGTCDPVDVMEEGDPCLIAARSAIARAAGGGA